MTGSTLGHRIAVAVMDEMIHRQGVPEGMVDQEAYAELVEDLNRIVDDLLPAVVKGEVRVDSF